MQFLHTIFPLHDFLYLLQLEEYNSTRYLHLLPRFFFRRQLQIRDHLRFTKRIHQMQLFTILLFAFIVSICTYFSIQILSIPLIFSLLTSSFILLPLTPIFVLITNLALSPWYNYLKHQKESQATKIIQSRPDLKIIAITGSYGKTTTKHVLFDLLKNTYRTQFTPGTINTPTGIAQWIIDKLAPTTEIAIIEMDAYTRGEIARSCHITPPDIALITNFGDQHLERFGSQENLTLAYLEAFTQAKPQATLLINTEEYQKANNYKSTQTLINNLTIQQFKQSDAPLLDNSKPISLTTLPPNSYSQLPTSVQTNILNAVTIAQQLQIPLEIINHALTTIQLPDRRGDTKIIDGYTILDRSYNISEYTAHQAVLEAVEICRSKPLIVITAGIPERGAESYQVNKKYGQFIDQYANHIILLQSIYAPAIIDGVTGQHKIHPVIRMSQALELAKTLALPNQCLILMQPELTDLSY